MLLASSNYTSLFSCIYFVLVTTQTTDCSVHSFHVVALYFNITIVIPSNSHIYPTVNSFYVQPYFMYHCVVEFKHGHPVEYNDTDASNIRYSSSPSNQPNPFCRTRDA